MDGGRGFGEVRAPTVQAIFAVVKNEQGDCVHRPTLHADHVAPRARHGEALLGAHGQV